MRVTRMFARLLLIAPLAALPGCGPRGGGTPGDVGLAGPPDFDPDSIADGYGSSCAALAWPFATRAFEVTPAGDLYNGEWRLAIRPAARPGGAPPAAITPAGPPRAIAYEGRWRPVAHWRRRGGGLRWDFEALALPGPPADSGLIASVEVRATNEGRAPLEASLELALEPRGADAPFVCFDAPDSAPGSARALPPGWAGRGAALAGGALEGGATGATAHRAWHLAPGESATARLVVPGYPVPATELVAWMEGAPHRTRAIEARTVWDGWLAQGAGFELGDPEVESAVRAALVVLLSCREHRGGHAVPVGNPFQYRDVWLRDGARAIDALSVAGYGREARELAEGLTLLQWPSGAFLSQAGQLDGTGQALWAMGQAFLRPAPDPAIGRVAAAVRAGWWWCERQRAGGSAAGGIPGLLPAGDPHDNEDVRAQLVGNDAWALAGYRWGARLLRAGAGRNDSLEATADSIERSYAGYLSVFRATLAKSGRADIPPSWQGSGLDWGNLAASEPCGALPPGEPRCAALARRLWARSGGAGLVTYRSPDSLSYYLGADLGTWAMRAGWHAAADSVLDALLRYRTASGGAAELFHRASLGYGGNLPPHATSAAALVSLVRNALVYDDGDTLELTLGARPRWWRGGALRRAPTRWGTIDLEFRSRADSASWSWTPVGVWALLHLPPGTALAAPPPSPLRGESGGRVVLAPPGFGIVEVRLVPAGRPPRP